MYKFIFASILSILFSISLPAQQYFTRDALVKFDATAPSSPEEIKAVNKSGTAVLDITTGDMAWKVLIKNFLFEKSLMQEHFNENYMESGKFPNATFSGKIVNLSDVNFKKDGEYKVRAKGVLEMHGVKKDVEFPGTIKVSGNTLQVKTNFSVACADYGIKIPGTVSDKVGKEVKISIDAPLAPKK
ncbi:MAG: YceI family protein [Saprospiraceae bacterium]|nr:YceI family protein [Saprospiraceae bacterium]